MEWDILAMVEVIFDKTKLGDNEIQALEQLLRKQDAVDNLVIHPQRITFYIWGGQAVDYKILDDFKGRLESLGYHDFTISATEYKKMARRELKGD